MSGPVRRIDSPTNPSVKAWRALHKKRTRDERGLFLIEGARETGRALAGSVQFTAVITGDGADAQQSALADEIGAGGAARYVLGEAALRKVSFRENPGQIIAVARTPGFGLDSLAPGESPLLLVADAIEKPGNLGAMIRSADGAGADGIIAADPICDLVNPNIIRASQGAVFTTPVAACEAPALEEWLRVRKIRVVAATGDAATRYWDADLTGAVAIVVGSEHAGLSLPWRQADSIAIPMAGRSDSLNASVAAAVVLYEAARQRR